MNILHAYKLYLPDPGGIQTVMQTLIKAQIKKFPIEVLVSRRAGVGYTEKVKGLIIRRCTSIGTALAMPLSPWFPLKFYIQSKKADIIDYHYPFPLVDFAIACGLPKRVGLIVHWHADIIAQKKTLYLVKPFIWRTLKRADKIIVASQQHIEHSEFLRAYREKCEVIPFGIPVQRWSHLTLKQSVYCDTLKAKYPNLIMAVGRLVSYKGYQHLIPAMQFVEGNLIIIGVGPLETELKRLAIFHKVAHKVHFMGKLDTGELKCFYHACSVFAFPSITPNEAFGVVQLEAMACKKPVVNTNIDSAVPWVARHQKEALTVNAQDEQQLAAALQHLLDNPSFAKKLGDNGYERVSTCFSEESFIQKTQNVYQDVYLQRCKSS